jgi:hypothetical protein
MMRRYPRVNPERIRGFGGPAVLPLFCLAPHGVFRASRITPRAVSSYLAFSPLPDLRCQRTGGVFSVTLSVTAILGLRRPRVFRGMLPYGVRTFLSGLLRSDHLPSRAPYHRFCGGKGIESGRKGRWNGEQEPADHRERNQELAEDARQISQHSAPPGAPSADKAFSREKLTRDGADQRSDQ